MNSVLLGIFLKYDTVYTVQFALYKLLQYWVKMTKTKNAFLDTLRKLFEKKTVLDMPQVCTAVSTMSRITGFRYLRELHQLTSYTHNGKYYTLPGIAQFDSDGFWYFGNIGFSVHGTLIDTLHQFITQSAAGKSNYELEKHCRVKVQAALRTLLHSKRIARVRLEKRYLYVNANPSVGDRQIRQRIETISYESAIEISD
jgi:hypothetical protein